jgi:hypothetical protein
MAGLIWTIQVVHYPLFDRVDPGKWQEFHTSHSARVSLVVGPFMAVEGLAALWLLVRRPSGVSPALTWGGAILVAVVLGTTVLLSVPFHDRLSKRFDLGAHHGLVATNWIRTVGWTLRGVVACAMIAGYVNRLTI